MRHHFLLLTLLCLCTLAQAAELHVAVAANFSSTMKRLIERFHAQSPHRIMPSYGASGKLYTQVQQGAPFDLVLSADSAIAEQLVRSGAAYDNSRVTYALGQLVLWSNDKNRVDTQGAVLASGKFAHLALASPKLAPYGMAAQQVLQRLQLWDALQARLVYGENVSQALQFVESGNAELGFVSLAQIKHRKDGSYWLVPAYWHTPLQQQMVRLKNKAAPDIQAASVQFWQFLQSQAARSIILEAGYLLPESH
ncbi:MAG: Molybdate-binding periplasmic protein [Pseudomonadota bacterium]|jgi:molybdate transport system substrate-binding protein